MPATIPPYGWQVPLLGEAADGPDGFLDLGTQIAATLANTAINSYTPSWTSLGSQQPSGPASRSGFYRVDHGVCDFAATITFGTSTSGGDGNLIVGLPLPARSTIFQQLVQAFLYTPTWGALVWTGTAAIDSGGSYTSARPHFSVSRNDAGQVPWASINGSFTGTSIPTDPAYLYSVQVGGSITVSGRYFVA